MPETLFRSLLNTLDPRSTGSVAGALGQPEHSVLRGFETSLTSMLAVLANKAGDTGALRRIMDSAPGGADVSWSQMAGEVSKPNSPLISGGQRAVTGLFGNSESAWNSTGAVDSQTRRVVLLVPVAPTSASKLRYPAVESSIG